MQNKIRLSGTFQISEFSSWFQISPAVLEYRVVQKASARLCELSTSLGASSHDLADSVWRTLYFSSPGRICNGSLFGNGCGSLEEEVCWVFGDYKQCLSGGMTPSHVSLMYFKRIAAAEIGI